MERFRKHSIPLRLIEVTKGMCRGSRVQIKQQNLIKKNGGIQQGCPLPTPVLNLFLIGIIRIWLNIVNGGTGQILLATN